MSTAPQHDTEKPETPQERFDRLYITSSEICRRADVTRTSVFQAKRRGLLPEPIAVNGSSLYIWERATAEPMLQAWLTVLGVRRRYHSAQQGTSTA